MKAGSIHWKTCNWKKMVRKILFTASVLLNVFFLIGWLSSPTQEIGRLQKDVRVGYFTSDSTMFTLPKGLTVRNASQRGISAIGQFENERFSVVITSDDPDLVNYDVPSHELNLFGNLYSANIRRGE